MDEVKKLQKAAGILKEAGLRVTPLDQMFNQGTSEVKVTAKEIDRILDRLPMPDLDRINLTNLIYQVAKQYASIGSSNEY